MDLRRLIRFGSGVGIEIRDGMLEIAVVRVRPAGIDVLGRATVANFRERPAAEWGAEYAKFLRSCGAAHLSATVLLPRRDTVVRLVQLPGVAQNDVRAAIEYQIDALHPFGDEEVAWGWSRAGETGALVGIVRRETLQRYLAHFSEAGIAVAAFSFPAAVMHAALRLHAGRTPGEFVSFAGGAAGGIEVYGESRARPVFSAEFDLPLERALALTAAELRLPAAEPKPFEQALPAPRANPVENDLSRNALPYATALAGACPRLAPLANLLPPEARVSNSRAMYIPTAALAAIFLAAAGALAAHSSIQDRRYLRQIEAEIARLEPAVRRSAALDGEIEKARRRAALLEEFHARSRADLEALNEITRLLPPPVWSGSLELTRTSAMIAGEAEQSATLLQSIDASPLFQNSEFTGGLIRSGATEVFRISAMREVKK